MGAGLTSVSADQITAQAATSEVVSETSSPDDSSEALLESEKAVDVNQTIETVNASDVVDNSESQSTEPESPVVEETEPESQPQEVISQTQEVQGTAATAEIADVKTVTSAENSNQVNLLKYSQPDNQVSNPPIAEDTIRVHFQAVTDDNYTQYGLWTWGAVAEPSDGNN